MSGRTGLRLERRACRTAAGAAAEILVATIDRPEARGALSRELCEALARAVENGGRDEGLRAIVVAATGSEIFCAGGDLKQFAELDKGAPGARQVVEMGRLLACVEECELPVIAAVSGDALGGGAELLMLFDLVVVERHATIQFRHALMGLAPAWGATTRLLERVGASWAALLLLAARPVGAAEAVAMGLAADVVDRGQALARALEIAAEIGRSPRDGVAAVKRSLLAVRRARRADALEREAEVFLGAWGSSGHRRAMAAFRRRARRR